jgi:hypothetical protein
LVTTRKRKKRENHIPNGKHSRSRGDLEGGDQVNMELRHKPLKK